MIKQTKKHYIPHIYTRFNRSKVLKRVVVGGEFRHSYNTKMSCIITKTLQVFMLRCAQLGLGSPAMVNKKIKGVKDA